MVMLSIVERSVVGDVKFFNLVKGYGFFRRSDGGADVFVHRENLPRELNDLSAGRPVVFDIQATDRGVSACNIELPIRTIRSK